MSDLQNPLFDEEKEFLERKKLEYERALRGDVDHIKEQSTKAGKVALVGAGLVGGIWLIAKAFGGKKRKKRNRYVANEDDRYQDLDRHSTDRDKNEHDDEFGAGYYTAGNGKRYKSVKSYKSAATSAEAFMAADAQGHETDDLGFGSRPTSQPAEVGAGASGSYQQHEPSPFDTEDFEDDPFQDMPYDDSRRLAASHDFDADDNGPVPSPANARSKMIGSVLQAFLKSDTGKVLVAQVAAVGLAMVTKKVSEFFPPAKNADLAASPGHAPAETGFAPVASTASPDSPDAPTHPSSI